MRIILFFLLATPLCLNSLFGDLTARFEQKNNQLKVTQTGRFYVSGSNLLRIDTEQVDQAGSPRTSIIFNSSDQVAYMVNHSDRTYVEMNAASMRALSDRMAEAQKRMQAQLEQIPESQRKMVEEMMRRQMGTAAQPEPYVLEVRPAGSEDGLRKYAIWINSEETRHLWAADPSDLDISTADLAVFEAMGQFWQELMKNFSNPMFNVTQENPFVEMSQIDGFPVRILDLEDQDETRMFDISNESPDPSLFEVPANYRKVSLTGQ